MSTKDAVLGSAAADISSVGPPATAVSSNADKNIIHQKRWVCDVCNTKWFLDFNEACAHEEQCKGVVETSSSSDTSDTASKRAAGNNECAAKAKKTVMSSEMKDDGASPTITPPPQSKKAAAILAAARAKARGIPLVENIDKKAKSVDIDILSDSSDDNNNAVNEVELVEGSSEEDSSSKRKSKRLRDATPPAKSNHDRTSSTETNKKMTKRPKAVKATKTNKLTSTKSNTSSLQSKKTEKKAGGPIASIFLPKSQQQKQNNGDTKSNSNSKKRAVETNNVQYKKCNQRSITSNKREVLEINSSSEDDDDEVVVVEKSSKKKKKNAVLGLSKHELREHQAADFFARRKKKAEEEKERQRKRDEARMARLNSKETSLKGSVGLVGDAKPSIVATSISSKATAHSADGATATTKISFLKSLSEPSKQIKSIPAPRFPCPSHIIPRSDDSDLALKSTAGASSSVLSKTPKFQHSKISMTASSEEEDDEDATMQLRFLDEADLINSESSIFTPFFSCNAIKMIKDDDESPALASQLWVDKYTMRKIPDDVIGEDNKEASKKLVDFVEEWKVRRHKAMQSMGQVKRKKKRRRKKKSSNGYDSDDSFLDDGGLENVFFISGPTASGKTRLVHAVAEQCECVVIEINTAEQRSGQALKRAVQETTQSHSSLAISKRKQDATGFFDNGKDDLVDSDTDRSDCDSDDESKEDGHSLTIILIDEVDLLFDDDTAFWPALAQLSQKAKCPIVLTATSIPAQLYYNNTIRYKSIELIRPSPAECCDKIDQVRKLEGMTLRDRISRDVGGLSSIAETYECDIRKILNEMQMFRHKTTQSVHSDIRQVNLAPSKLDAPSSFAMNDNFPDIFNIQPRIVPKNRHTILTITGTNLFQSELFIGGKLCKHFAVVSDSMVIAVCPPCTFPDGVTRDAIYEEEQHLDCLSSKFAEVVLRKRCRNSGLVLDSKTTYGSESRCRTNWNVEYDFPLRESKFDQQMSRQAFIREAKAKMKRQQNQKMSDEGFMSSEEEFEGIESSEEAPSEIETMEEEQAEEETQIEETDADAEALLNDALSNIHITPFSPSKDDAVASRESLEQSALDLSSFANELARFSDASLFESSFSLHVPQISGAVEGFGEHLFGSESSESDPTIEKLSKGKYKKPPCFETIYQTGVNDSEFFFGESDSFICHPNRPRERQLLCLSEMNSRGLGRLDVELKEDVVDADSNSGFSTAESDSMFPLIPTRTDSEDDMLLGTNAPSAFLSLPSLLMKCNDGALNAKLAKNESPLLDIRRNQTCMTSMYAMFEMLTNGKSWCFGLRHGACHKVEMMQRKTMTVAGGALLDSSLALDYLPYLREISQYENKARFKVQEMMKRNGEADTGARKTRSSRRNIRRHYLEEFYPGRFDGNIESISAQLAQSYMC
eukprot:scaffold627_cov144-Skeletonema_menzelii.AAC.21